MVGKIQTDSYGLGNNAVAQWAAGTDRYNYDDGAIHLRDGTVAVMMSGDKEHAPRTRLDFVHGGRHYIVVLKKRYTRRGVVSVARRVLRQVQRERA